MQNDLFKVDADYLLKALQKIIDENPVAAIRRTTRKNSKKIYKENRQNLSSQKLNTNGAGGEYASDC